tara:strand:- start:863 stop:1255 length:393 start_codon:yes stop_codon:yes gene_type:complete
MNEKKISPTKSRDRALQSLYEMEISNISLKEIVERYKKDDSSFFRVLLAGVAESIEELDKKIKLFIDIPLSKLDPIERNTLRIALFELERGEVDRLVIISEAIRLSKKFGSTDGYKFINAVLDKFIKKKS